MRTIATIRDKLTSLTISISAGHVATAAPWVGADVIITDDSLLPPSPGFYPEPRAVVTEHVGELSWLFESLRDIFKPVLNGQNKIEFYGRLANAANRYISRHTGEQELRDILGAVLHEAFAMADEMAETGFASFAIAFGNEIIDDHIDEAERSGFIDTSETRRFLEELARNR